MHRSSTTATAAHQEAERNGAADAVSTPGQAHSMHSAATARSPRTFSETSFRLFDSILWWISEPVERNCRSLFSPG
jgi:hypothetical protein